MKFFKFCTLFICFLCLLLLVYFQINSYTSQQSASQRLAERLGAEVRDDNQQITAVGEGTAGLSLYLTLETDAGQGEDVDLYINDVRAGNLHGDVLAVHVEDGDVLTLQSRRPNITVRIADFPATLDDNKLAASVTTGRASYTLLGTVVFR